MPETKTVVAEIVPHSSLQQLYWKMPDTSTNQHQRKLEEKYGTPREFARAVIAVIPAISVAEAEKAINTYFDEWIGR